MNEKPNSPENREWMPVEKLPVHLRNLEAPQEVWEYVFSLQRERDSYLASLKGWKKLQDTEREREQS